MLNNASLSITTNDDDDDDDHADHLTLFRRQMFGHRLESFFLFLQLHNQHQTLADRQCIFNGDMQQGNHRFPPRPRNFEPSRGICPFAPNFNASADFCKIREVV